MTTRASVVDQSVDDGVDEEEGITPARACLVVSEETQIMAAAQDGKKFERDSLKRAFITFFALQVTQPNRRQFEQINWDDDYIVPPAILEGLRSHKGLQGFGRSYCRRRFHHHNLIEGWKKKGNASFSTE